MERVSLRRGLFDQPDNSGVLRDGTLRTKVREETDRYGSGRKFRSIWEIPER